MLLSPEEIKQETRGLWKSCFHDSEEFMDLYFEDKYTDEDNITLRPDGFVAGAVQVLPYRMTFYQHVIHAGYISGLSVHPDYRGKGMAVQLLREAHRKIYNRNGAISFLIPGCDRLRKFYERTQHGAYWTSTYRMETEIRETEETDDRIVVEQPEEWRQELYVFYRRNTSGVDFMLHPSETDFFAALANEDMAGGYVLTARKNRRLCGICLARKEKDGRMFIHSLLVENVQTKNAFIRFLKQADRETDKVYARVPAPGSHDGSVPYAMARVINVERFLNTVLKVYPDFQLHIGVDGDLDIPENNGYYLLENGKVIVTDRRPDSIVTPGGLAAMFLSSYPMYVEMMLDE